MRRTVCFLLSLAMLLTACVSCGDNTDNNSLESTGDETTASVISQKIPAEKYDGVFRVGYDRQDITPEGAIYLVGGTTKLTSVLDPLYATCIAINDGETTALLYTVDVLNIAAEHYEVIRTRVSKATGIERDNIILSATHTHSAPQPGIVTNRTENVRWSESFYKSVITAAENAIADLADAEVYIGSTRAEGMAFTNRWILSDGTPSSIWRLNYEYKERTDRVA